MGGVNIKEIRESRDLMALRHERDSQSLHIRRMTWNGEKYVDDMIACRMSGYHHLRQEFFASHYHHTLDMLDTFMAVCLRVGRLEHEAAGQPIENYDMAHA
jgi:hypothetical protein